MPGLGAARERWFPSLRASDYSVTSPATTRYNCFAWALGIDDRWIEPDEDDPRRIFSEAGFAEVSDAEADPATDKIALYADELGVTHAARQLPNGRWTSKLGNWEDIEHADPDSLTGSLYGSLLLILSRPRPYTEMP